MNTSSRESPPHPNSLTLLPSWVTSARAEAPEYVAFLSGALLSHLHTVLSYEAIPIALVRDRLALRAAEVTVGFSGRRETIRDLRDVYHFLGAGDLPGPAGGIYLTWRRAVHRSIRPSSLHKVLDSVSHQQISTWYARTGEAPVEHAVKVLEEALCKTSLPETTALILADATLARALGWERIIPLFALGLKRGDLTLRDDRLRMACHRALNTAVIEILRLISECTRNAAQLSAVVPTLRAKGAKDAVQIFLTQDSVAASALPLPDRAARRLCDRLVSLGVVRELSGRDSFRLYGI